MCFVYVNFHLLAFCLQYELEKALLEGERQMQLSDILDDENRLEAIKHQEQQLMDSDNAENLFDKVRNLTINCRKVKKTGQLTYTYIY